ncbi:MAG: stage VI sporulation protein F [Erysipelotrichales bacterium]|nr:stage VI sporulation protein F [Erysipelotrichales bacterium]
MELNDSLFSKVEKKTNVSKENIVNIASKLNEGNMKDPKTLSEIIQELSTLTGKKVSKEKEDKIIDLIVNDKVPNNVDKMF